MGHSRLVMLGVCVLGTSSALADTRVENRCSDVLRLSFVDRSIDERVYTSKAGAYSWVCSTDFSEAQRAIDAGLEIIIPEIDLPVGASFTKQSFEQWKSHRCSTTTWTDQRSERIWKYRAQISDAMAVAINAWSECMQGVLHESTQSTVDIRLAQQDQPDVLKLSLRWSGGGVQPEVQLELDGLTCARMPKTISATDVGGGVSYYCDRARVADQTCYAGQKSRGGFKEARITGKAIFRGGDIRLARPVAATKSVLMTSIA